MKALILRALGPEYFTLAGRGYSVVRSPYLNLSLREGFL